MASPPRSQRTPSPRRLPALLAALALAGLAPAAANHPQSDTGRTVAFDHVTGNEWWVEVALSGADAGSVSGVEAQDTNGPWTPLAKRSWGPYAASFHIEPGHPVRFRTTWAGGAQQVSCWFTHPAGAEQCAAPPTGWAVHALGDGGQFAGQDMAVGDADRDGRNELYVATPQGLWQFAWTNAGWARTQVWVPDVHFSHVAAGDITGDGLAELFAVWRYEGNSQVQQFEWDGQAWQLGASWSAPAGQTVGDLLVADVEDDGLADLYWGTTTAGSILMQVEVEPDGGWSQRHVVPIGSGVSALAAGDADNDGDAELFVGSGDNGDGDILRVDLQESSGETTFLHDEGIGGVTALAVGDPDRDGRRELYAAHAGGGGVVLRLAGGAPTPWTATRLPALPSGAAPQDLAVGDADNDGDADLYAPGSDGHAYRLHWTGAAWAAQDLAATPVRHDSGLVLADGDGDGLRELYVAGMAAACCSNPVVQVTDHPVPPRPPAPWHESLVGDAGGRSGLADIAIGDGDRDGQKEVYVAARHGLHQFDWTGSTWRRTVLSSHAFHRVAVGDGDRDGRVDVYASGAGLNGGYEIVRFAADGAGGWSSAQVFSAALPAGTLSIGDADDDGLSELYVVMMPEFGGDEGSMPSYQLEFEGGSWQVRYIANVEGGARSSWIGDADRDGDRDLYAVGSDVWRLDITGGGSGPGVGSLAFVGGDLPGEDNWLNGIVAADGDRDGRQEVYVGATRFHDDLDAIYRYSVRPDGWERQAIPLPRLVSANDLALGDADSDGSQEIYFSGWDGGLWQLRWTGSGWATRQLADVGSEMGWDLAVGDADGDGRQEAYMSAYDSSRAPPHNVYRLGSVPPPERFDAAFTGVRGNEWWIQAGVAAAGGTVAAVDVRLDGGAWRPLARQSWGWAASYHAVQGTVVQFRATSAAGATDLSDCYRWIPPPGVDAGPVACAQLPPPGFDAQFSNVKGNEWWVEAMVSANEPLRAVEARVDCGSTWHALTLRSWGAWAASFHVPSGSKVDFRASGGTGHEVSGGYAWPSAAPAPPC